MSLTPLESCCCGCSLRTGVAIIAWLGVISGCYAMTKYALVFRIHTAMESILPGIMMMMTTMESGVRQYTLEFCSEHPSEPLCGEPALRGLPMANMAENTALPIVKTEQQANSLWMYLLLFRGIFDLLRSAVGIYASSCEQVAPAQLYMRSWLVIMALNLFSFAKALMNPLGSITLGDLLYEGLLLYFTMVTWSFYRQLGNKNQRSALDGKLD